MKPAIHAGMATMPSRKRTARLAIRSILPQVTRLYLYLDGFDSVPSFARHPKIVVLRSQDYPGLNANGKLLGMIFTDQEGYYVTVDDDYWYPRRFVSRLWKQRLAIRRPLVIGVHGCILKSPFKSYLKDRTIFTSWKPLPETKSVDVVATCGTLHDLADLCFDVRNWNVTNQVDLHFAQEMKAAGVTGAVVRRGWFWLVPLRWSQSDSIFAALKRNDEAQTALARKIFIC